MPIHDAYPRVTPYELLLPEEDFADQWFPRIQAEAEERGVAVNDPQTFALLSEVGAIMRAIRGEEDDPQSIHQTGILLFHAYHLWKEGLPFFFLQTEAARYLVGTGPAEGSWLGAVPSPAGYLQLPQHLFWVGGESGHAESVDGFFWSAPDGENLSVLIVMGIRRDRPGYAVVPLPTLPLKAAGEWASTNVRTEGDDFRSPLPGAEQEGLYSLEAGAEAVKLAMRLFWYLDSFSGSIGELGDERAQQASRPDTPEGGGPIASRLPARHVVLDGG
jgi:hypothetical protein